MISSLRPRLARKAYGIAALAALTGVAFGTAAPSASASATPRPQRLAAISGPTAERTSTRLAMRSRPEAALTLACPVTVDPPFEYYGGTYGGGEEGIAEAYCNGTVYELYIITALFLNGTEVASSTNTEYSTASAPADAIYPLSAGDYRTESQACFIAAYGGSWSCGAVSTSSTVYLP